MDKIYIEQNTNRPIILSENLLAGNVYTDRMGDVYEVDRLTNTCKKKEKECVRSWG